MSARLSYGRWACLPGNFDVVRALQTFPADNELGIPAMSPYQGDPPDFLLPWTQRVRSDRKLSRSARHFFLDDYRFESLWTSPNRYLDRVRETGYLLTPDFSLWTDQPVATQIWNTFRNRWMGVLWQREGADVIPTVSWSDARSYDFCFLGIPQRSVVAVSTVGIVRNQEARKLFIQGYEEMLRRLDPRLVIIYGKPIDEVSGLVTAYHYRTRWDEKKSAR